MYLIVGNWYVKPFDKSLPLGFLEFHLTQKGKFLKVGRTNIKVIFDKETVISKGLMVFLGEGWVRLATVVGTLHRPKQWSLN